MTALRSATLDEYLTWLRAWLDAGHQPTHAYDYPWSQWTWLTATRDFQLGGECGANAVHILMQPGIRHVGGGLGHNQLYFADGVEQRGGTVPVFSDPVFEMLPGVREFIAGERRKTAEWMRERADAETARQLAAAGSDVPRLPETSKGADHMTYLPLTPTLTPTQALAAATGYGWTVVPHDNGGFFAQREPYRMIVTFAPDGSFRCANVREGFDGMPMMLSEEDVVGSLVQHGNPERPVSSEEKTL